MQKVSSHSAMQFNTRSVLRPEYLNFANPDYTSYGNFYQYKHYDRRINTNTAPVYSTEDFCSQKQRRLARRVPSHPYFRSSTNESTSNLASDNYNFSQSQNLSPYHAGVSSSQCQISPNLSDSRWSQDSLRQNKTSSRRMSTYGHNSRHRGSAICAENTSPNTSSNNSHPRPYSHGQAEQLRRSRESTTFALIDNQLSKPPLNQVRDLYLQNRGSVNSSNSGPTRTTKKANLSAVHTIVRFRIKEYLYPLLAHYRRMLDTLFARIYPNYTPSMRDSLASQILGQSQLPCSLSCEFCERFKFQLDRHVSCRKMMLNKAALPSKLSSAKPSAGYYNSLNGDCYDGSANSCPISPNESVSRSRRYTLPPPIQPSTASTPLTSATAATSAKSCFVKPECSIDASSLSSPSSPRLNSEALDHNSESELLDDLQSVVDDGTPLAFHSSQRMLNDSSDVKRTRVDSATLRWHDLFDIPFNVDFNSMDDDNSLDLHSILNANSDLKIESFPDDTSTFPACDDVEGLSKFSLLENLARIDEGDSSISLKPEHLSPPQTPPRSFPCGGNSSSSSCVSQNQF
uniref:Serine/threonine-protein kinase Doa n=1 Tax=Mesocestoides corti TaxID=53468 RepID=A0A5K3FEV0_MESCO